MSSNSSNTDERCETDNSDCLKHVDYNMYQLDDLPILGHAISIRLTWFCFSSLTNMQRQLSEIGIST